MAADAEVAADAADAGWKQTEAAEATDAGWKQRQQRQQLRGGSRCSRCGMEVDGSRDNRSSRCRRGGSRCRGGSRGSRWQQMAADAEMVANINAEVVAEAEMAAGGR